ncbi:MurR/RpiR family transcriptional regulator [[Acholeplasma] multilocale]|uniref:MurR/RpiR family transcriptional regulator n=1 Tax=[Acholeplasma] multilocale TaxID=264638 RepID=UPI0003FAFC80|nr:MurR/RpiR family transcriptional regulator [[Acholeplasma] multilocale]
MNSIISQIDYLKKESKGLDKVIAEEIFANFIQNKFLSSKELANKTYVSQATLTKFAKKTGAQGYNEMILRLRMEYENLRQKYSDSISKTDDLKKSTINMLDDMDSVMPLLKEAVAEIESAPSIHLFPSYQMQDDAVFFGNYLSVIRGNVNIVYPTFFSPKSLENIKDRDLLIFFVSGPDTKGLEFYYNRFKNSKKHKIILFCTNDLEPNFSGVKYNFIIDSVYTPNNILYRRLIMSYCITAISVLLKTKQ